MSDHTQPADIKPTEESIHRAMDVVSEAMDNPDCRLGKRLVHLIAVALTRKGRELTLWLNQEIQEKTESLRRAFVKEAERRMRAQSEVDDLKQELDALKVVIGRGIKQFHGTTWTHDLPKDPAGLEQCIERLRRTDGTHADAAVIVWEQCQMLVMEIDRLRSVIARHDLCHNLHGQVDARAFADGCTDEQRKLFGCAPDADAVPRLRAALERIACRDQGEVGPHMEEPRAAAIAREVLGQ